MSLKEKIKKFDKQMEKLKKNLDNLDNLEEVQNFVFLKKLSILWQDIIGELKIDD